MSDAPRPKATFEITGRTVLFAFIAFFGVVFTVNAIMVRAATSTFGGVETASSYKTGLSFRHETEVARAQDARRWDVETRIVRDQTGEAVIEAAIRDAAGNVPTGLSVSTRLAHPTDARRDHALLLDAEGSGRFRGRTGIDAGQWDLVIDITRNGERVFRSRNRIILR